MAGSSKNLVTQWIVTWGLLGGATGFGLFFGDTGHLPASWILIIVPVGGAAAGLMAAVGFRWVLYLLPDNVGRDPIGRLIAGAIVGAGSAFLLGWFVLGVQWRYALIWGALAGLISVLIGLRLKTKAESERK